MRLGMGRHLTPQQRRYRGRGIHVDTTSSSDLPRIMGKQKPKDPSYSDGNKEPPLPQLFSPFLSLLVLPHAKYRGSLGERAEERQSKGYGEAYRVAFSELMRTSWHVGIHLRLFTRVPATKRAQPASRGY